MDYLDDDLCAVMDVLRAFAYSSGWVDLDAVETAGHDLQAMRPALELMQGPHLELGRRGGGQIDTIRLLGQHRQGLPDPPVHPGALISDDPTPATLAPSPPPPPTGPPATIQR